MAHGLADHTSGIYVQGSVTIPISIVASTITFDVNIVDCSATLDVNITASSVTFSAVVTASDIMMPVDIQAQYITLDINIAASAVTLNVAITSSAVTLNVAITSSAVTLNVNISSTTGNININLVDSEVTLDVNITNASITVSGAVTITGSADVDIVAQSVGVSVQGEWQSEQGGLTTLYGTSALASGANFDAVNYTVPANKELMVYGWWVETSSYVIGADNPQEMSGVIKTGAVIIMGVVVGEAQQTQYVPLATPIRYVAGAICKVNVVNYGPQTGYAVAGIYGYTKDI